jgi:Response regulator containing CheY-like receiver, AAA-type ATPase, and DNA-binding domains
LRTIGWAVDSCSLESVSNHSCDVGLFRLQPFHLEHPEAVKDMISRSGTEWIAVLSADVLKLRNVGDFVCEWFFDFHTLPFDVSRVQVTLGRAFGMARLRGHATTTAKNTGHELLGQSRVIHDLRKLLGKLAPTESPILIRGESGTGKELVARTLHRESQRNGKPFVAINCGAIPEHLIQSELFGHEKGAFTGAHQRKIGRIETANGGTLFLDEIGDLPLELQANLLRFLQEKHIERVGEASRSPLMFGCLQQPTSIWKQPLSTAGFVKICTTGLTYYRSSPPLYGIARVIWHCWPITFPIFIAWRPGVAREPLVRMHCLP